MVAKSATTEKKAKVWTQRGLEAIKVKVRTDLTDPDTKGLQLRITPKGTKTWSYVYRQGLEKARVQIGKFGNNVAAKELSLADARTAAKKLAGHIAHGQHPAADAAAKRKADTVSELLDNFIAKHPKPSALWTKQCARIFERNVKPIIGSVKLPELQRRDIRAVLEKLVDKGSLVAANRTLAALRRALAWGVEQDHLAINPATNIKTGIQEQPKDRALTQAEIATFWRGLDAAPMGTRCKLALKLALVTGQRPGEVCGIALRELDLANKVWTLPKGRTKNGRLHALPLSALALEIIEQAMALDPEQPWLFTTKGRGAVGVIKAKPMDGHSLSHALRDSLEALGFAENPFTPHDLRRTCATHMARLGFSDHVVGKVLNHQSGKAATITAQVYVQHDFLPEKRAALEAWGNEIERIIGRREAITNVVTLRV